MSSYHSSFTYLGKNSTNDFKWIISHFEADVGTSDTGLSTESIYTTSADGTYRNLYGTKYAGAEPIHITVIKQDGSDFSIDDNRKALKWLTGAKTDSWLDLYVGEEIKYRMRGHVQNVLQYKMDARIVGLTIIFESASPFAFSSVKSISKTVSSTGTTIKIQNDTDDIYNYTRMKTVYTNGSSKGSLVITNTTTGDETTVSNIAAKEIITLDTNDMATSDKKTRILGSDFNYVFPRLAPGENSLTVKGNGSIEFYYYYCIKIGDMAIDLNAVSDPICDESNNIVIDMLDWNRITNTPRTLAGYGIADAYNKSSVYNKTEIDNKVSDVVRQIGSIASLVSQWSDDLSADYYNKEDIDDKFYDFYNKIEIRGNYYNKTEIDSKVSNVVQQVNSIASLVAKCSVDLNNDYYNKTYIDDMFYTKPEIKDDYYNKAEINKTTDGIKVKVQNNASLISSVVSDLSKNYYTKANINDSYYNKTQIDDIISGLTFDSSGDIGSSVMWSQIINKPTMLSEYGVESEVQEMINKSIADAQISIDEAELDAMLNEVLWN